MRRREIGLEDVFLLKEHINDTSFSIDNYRIMKVSLMGSNFYKLMQHHDAKLSTLA